jgi:Ca-activated chloride channel homolog
MAAELVASGGALPMEACVERLNNLIAALHDALSSGQAVKLADMEFGESRAAILALSVLLAATILALLASGLRSNERVRARVALPAVLSTVRRSRFSITRHLPLLLFLLGLPLFAVALADPYSTFSSRQVSHSGRRIALMIDASLSMNQPFTAAKLHPAGGQTYFATVAAAEYFVRLRRSGPNRDLVSLIEFGNEAYVVTPFTSDYDNVLLSLHLIAAPQEWDRFPDQGTVILQGIRQAIRLFETFDFLDASGNAMVIFSDGQDTQTLLNGLSIADVMAEAQRDQIPVYFIRMPYKRDANAVESDGMWRRAVALTGGKFYPADDEDAILHAIHDIDRLAPGRVNVREYVARQPRFAPYALAAFAVWTAAVLFRLGLRNFRSFP